MNRPEGISESAWEAAKPKAIEFVDWLGRFTVDADAEHVLTTTIALALQSSVEAERAAERERCAKVADAIAAGRSRQKMEATTAKKRTEARDFESMAMSAIEVSYEIRKGA